MIKINKNNINLYDTITCGQIFRYIVSDNEYTLILSDRVVKLKEDDNYIYITSSLMDNIESVVSKYLDLDTDYDSINEYIINKDESLKDIIDCCNGFKVINSPKLETIISYMISANNNVRNITKSVNMMCELYGEKIEFLGTTYYLFPKLSKLKELKLDDFINLKLGFRSEYIYNFVNSISESDIDYIDSLSTDDALIYLTSFKGIGLKIASCILLFGYKRFDVFPIDTWVKKYMSDKYGINDINKIKEYSKRNYDKYSGLVIQYMFHSKRNKV